MTFYDKFIRKCNEIGKAPTAVASELGFNKSIVSNWKTRGNTPSDTTLLKIADYFNISIFELLPAVIMPLEDVLNLPPVEAYMYFQTIAADRGTTMAKIVDKYSINPALFQSALFKRPGYDDTVKFLYKYLIEDYEVEENQPTADDSKLASVRENIIEDIKGLSDDELNRLKAILRAAFPDKFSQ